MNGLSAAAAAARLAAARSVAARPRFRPGASGADLVAEHRQRAENRLEVDFAAAC
jgi:hypothetical protein